MKKEVVYHFIGIGGVSMSALAQILSSQGIVVQGSDYSNNDYVKRLRESGIKVFIGHKAENVKGAEIVVYNSAIAEDNEELVFARENNLKILSRAEMLFEVSNDHEKIIAVSGAHGKTTTTAMITEVFCCAGLFPTAHLGGVLKSQNSNFVLGEKKYFITEACEYKDNFLKLNPTISIILNVEPEHLDYFKTFENVQSSFEKFAQNSQFLVCNDKVEIVHPLKISFGNTGYLAKNIKQIKNGCYKFDCFLHNKKLFKIKLNIVGKHNIFNALACIAVCRHFNISAKCIKKTLRKYKGVLRRYEVKKNRPFIVHDYAHHPSEIRSVINATRNFRKGRIIVAFQPHTFSRTKTLMNEFKVAFDGADEIYIIKTYSAREKKIPGGTARDLFFNLQDNYFNIEYFASFNACYNHICDTLKNNDTLLILGAGDIDKLAEKFDKKKR